MIVQRLTAAMRTRYRPAWHHGEEVTVIGFDTGYVRVLGDGKETAVFVVNIDSGWDEQYAPGKWRERRKLTE